MGMLSAYRDAYEALAVRSHATVATILEEEREQFGMDHCQAGSRLCRSWQLPREFAEAAAHHHEIPGDHSILALVQLSCRLAEAIGYVAITHEEIDRPLAIIHHFAPQSFRERAEQQLGNIESRAMEETEKFEF
jgi:HD-like signal output (HDOD) protein